MATRILTANATLSTSAGSWKVAEFANLPTNYTAANYDDAQVATRTTAAFNVSGAGVSLQGVFLGLRKLGATGTFTCTLQEGNLPSGSGSWTSRANTGAINVTTVANEFSYVYIPFSAPYTSTTNEWRLQLTCTVAARILWLRSGSAADYAFALIGNQDDASAPASGDTWLIQNSVALTVDQAATLGPVDGTSLCLGDQASILMPNPASAFTFALAAGNILMGTNCIFRIGTSGTPVTAANKITLTTALTSGFIFNVPNFNFATSFEQAIEIYGVTSSGLRLKLNGDAAASQAVVNTQEVIPGTWVNGDTVTFAAKDQATADSTTYTITISGANQVTLGTNLNTKAVDGGAIINLSEADRMGVKFTSTNQTSLVQSTSYYVDHAYIQGLYLTNIAPIMPGNGTAAHNIDGLVATINTASGNSSFNCSVQSGSTVSNVHILNASQSTSGCGFWSKSATYDKITLRGFGAGFSTATVQNFAFNGTNAVASDVVIANSFNGTTFYGFGLSGYAHVISDVTLVGVNSYIAASSCTINNLVQQRCPATGYGWKIDNAVNNVFNNSTIGIGATNGLGDIQHISDTFSTTTFNNCNLGTLGVDANYANTVSGTFVRFVNYNNSIGDHRAWYTNGTFLSSSDAIVEISNNAVSDLTDTYYTATATVTGTPINAIVNCTIDNAAYYAGTHALPKLTVGYDGGSTSTDTATATTSVQQLLVPITPTTDNNNVTLSLITKTDAAVANAEVTWDSLELVIREYGNEFITYPITISQTTENILANVDTPGANAFITVANPVTVAAYTEFTINHATQTVTVTADTTLDRLYDYSQYNLTLTANLGYAEWFTTTDGINYTSTYDITLNTGVDLTGSGSIDLGSGTLTLTGTATYDGVIIDSNGRSVLLSLSGLISGSVVQIYNTTNSVEIFKDTVSATSLNYRYIYAADKAVRVRVRYVNGVTGYLPYSTTGTITSNGFAAVVSQQDADIYNQNNFDGSTATEFDMDEGVILIEVDDPNNQTTAQRMYNWYLWQISQEDFIDDQDDLVVAQTSFSYVLDDSLQIKNLDGSNPLYISGANINNVSGDGQVIDTTGGSININGYFPFASADDVGDAVWGNSKALTTPKFLALR